MIRSTVKNIVWVLRGGYKPKRFWDSWAHDFIRDPWQVKTHSQHKWLAGIIKKEKPETILEVGCGFGRNIKFLIKEGIDPSKITGSDISQNMIDLAKEFIGNSKVQLITSDILNFNSREKFDFVFTHGVLMHVAPIDIKKTIKKIFLLSKKHVVFIEQNYPADNDYTFIHDYKNLIKSEKSDIIEYRSDKKLGLDLIYVKVRKK